MECGKVTSVLVIDDHPVARHGCRRVLERIGITTIFEAGDGVTGYELFGRHRPDVVIVDLALGANCLGGLSLIRRFSSESWGHWIHSKGYRRRRPLGSVPSGSSWQFLFEP